MDDLRPAGPAEYRWLLAVQERERRLLARRCMTISAST